MARISPGRYHDGLGAGTFEVEVRSAGTHLLILDLDGAERARWPLEEVRYIEPVGCGPMPVRLRCLGRDDRLSFHDAGLAGRLPVRAPVSHGRLVPLLMALGLGSAVLTFLVVLPVLAKFAAATLPVEWERRWGKHIAAQIVREAGRTCEVPAAQAALNGLAGRLARAAGYTGPVQVTVLPSKSVNAFAVPGGAIFVLDGLIQEARSDEELAGVLGHEVAHVQRRHSLERMAAQSGAVALTAIATGDVISPFSGAVLWLLGQSYSRDQEAEADRLGMEMLSRLGIATAPTRDLFRRMGAAAPGGGLWERLLSDHPQAEQRIRAIPDNPGRARALADRDWKEIREMCRKTPDDS